MMQIPDSITAVDRALQAITAGKIIRFRGGSAIMTLERDMSVDMEDMRQWNMVGELRADGQDHGRVNMISIWAREHAGSCEVVVDCQHWAAQTFTNDIVVELRRVYQLNDGAGND